MMMPADTNAYGTIFGGVLLSHIDVAGMLEARKAGRPMFVTVAMDAIEFKEPVFVGDVVSFHTETLRIGRTSVRVRITVWAERHRTLERVKVTVAEATYVAVDEARRPVPVRAEPRTDSRSEGGA
jgi:acyl-CoA thioesterase YciA